MVKADAERFWPLIKKAGIKLPAADRKQILKAVSWRVETAPPVIAKVHGNCLAGGTDLALGCDMGIVAEDAGIGFPATRYRLVCFVIAGTLCGLAGALLANNTDFISPAVMYWTRSGDLMVMVILGGMGTLFGPVVGAIVYLVLEEFLSQVTEYWALIMGPLLLLIVLFGRGGIMGLLGRLSRG